MAIKASKLRENIYQLLDEVARTGVPLEIDRKGKRLAIVSMEKKNKLDNLKKRDILAKGVKPEDLVHMDWSKEWKPYI